MIPAHLLIHAPDHRCLAYSREERPLALQLGGACPDTLAEACRIATSLGYDEINLNAGCPSKRVQAGLFGAALMADPAHAAQCVRAMTRVGPTPISVKCRIGIDDQDPATALPHFLESLIDAGVNRVYLHARKALLNGLGPAANRSIPPLQPELVYAMKQRWRFLSIIFNGGIDSAARASEPLERTDGIMIGRAAYHHPELLGRLSQTLARTSTEPERPPTRDRIYATSVQALRLYAAYAERRLTAGDSLTKLCRPVLGLFKGLPGAKRYRRHLTTSTTDPRKNPRAGAGIFDDALAYVHPPEPAAAPIGTHSDRTKTPDAMRVNG